MTSAAAPPMTDAADPASIAAPNSDDLRRFADLQRDFARSFGDIFPDPHRSKSVLIVPSLSLDGHVLSKISGAHHYEERQLCLLLLLRMPRTRVIYVTSTPIHEAIVDYYLHLLPGIPSEHARARLTLLSCDDASPAPLSQKILARPRLMERIKSSIADPSTAHMTCFTVSELERRLALRLGIPIFGCDPSLLHWGSKSGSRQIFKEAGIDHPLGYEDLGSPQSVAEAVVELKARKPDLEQVVVKLNEGFSGEGNAVLDLKELPTSPVSAAQVRGRLPQMAFEARDMSWERFAEKIATMGAVVEEFVPGKAKRSPSAQLRIDPAGSVEAISTHDQVLGGRSGQIFLGCRFPADQSYRLEVQTLGLEAARALAARGVIGRLGVDFISVKEGLRWRHLAIEVNLRKGGTTHPFQMLQFLTDGHYDPATGDFLTPAGQPRCYYASDNLESERYRGLTPLDLIDIAVMNGLHFHAASGQGVAFHLIGALSEFGKLGVVCIGDTVAAADELYRRTVGVLDAEGQRALISQS
ncbi:MAG: peptide ligase PGM1-related protein [Hyphomicrobiaceae bacterium]